MKILRYSFLFLRIAYKIMKIAANIAAGNAAIFELFIECFYQFFAAARAHFWQLDTNKLAIVDWRYAKVRLQDCPFNVTDDRFIPRLDNNQACVWSREGGNFFKCQLTRA